MKKVLRLLLVVSTVICGYSAQAQLPNGSIAPDFTLTDINGVTYNLYDELEAGKSILLDISATWCPPCWSYHNSGILEDIYEDYGPNGTDQVRVFMVEGDDATNLACLYGPSGCNNSTMGNWVAGTQYPIFSPGAAQANDFINSYQLGYWPTLYGISPIDNTTQLINQASYGVWESWLIDSWQMDATYTVTDSDCPYEGMVDLEPILGFGTLDFEWSNGSTDEDLVNVPAGTYSVTITDDHNVDLVMDNIVVGGSTAEALSVSENSIDDVDCFGSATGALSVTAVGGSGSFTYSWSNGMTGSAISGLEAGDYEVVCTDAAGCQVVQSYTIGTPDELTSFISPISTSCGEDNGFVYVSGSGGVTPYYYDLGFGPTPNGSFSSLPPGDYMVTIEDFNGCVTSDFFTIEDSEAPEAVAEASGSIDCSTTMIEVSASNSSYTGNVDYYWSTDDGVIEGSGEIETIIVSSPGTYELTLVETITGCISEAMVVVEGDQSAPMAQIADVDILDCNTTTVTLDGTQSSVGDDILYLWTTTDGSIIGDVTSPTIDVDASGTYELLVTNTQNGCTSIASSIVQADIEAPVLSVNGGVITCAESEVDLCAEITEGHTLIWTTPTGQYTETCITVAEPGEYLASVTAPNGCQSEATAIVTISNDVPQISMSTPEVITCTITSVVVEAEISGNLDDQMITWTDADGNILATGTDMLEVSSAGVYELTVINAIGCVAVSNVTVEEDINTPAALFNYTIDTEGNVTLTNTSNTTGSASFTLPNGDVIESEEVNLTFDEAGDYEICMTLTNECGSDQYCEVVSFGGVLSVSVDKLDILCHGANDGSAQAVVSGGQAAYSYIWLGPNGYMSEEADIDNLAPGVYTLTVQDAAGSEVQSEITIVEPTEIIIVSEVISDETDGAANGSISVVLEGGTGDYTYSWSDGSTNANLTDLAQGEYLLIVTDSNGCQKEFGPYVVNNLTGVNDLDVVLGFNMYPIPAASEVNIEATLQIQTSVQLSIQDVSGRVLWTQDYNTNKITETISLHTFQPGMYTLTFISGNKSQSEKFIVIR